MKKWPRWVKILLCLVLITVAFAILIYAMDPPADTPEEAFRREEKEYLIGPAEILDTLELHFNRRNYTILGKSAHGYTTFSWQDDKWDDGRIFYCPKAGDITLFTPRYNYVIWYHEDWQLPFFAFTDLKAAHRAEMTLAVTLEGETEEFHLSAELRRDGYFLFCLDESIMSRESLRRLQVVMEPAYVRECAAIATVTVFDRQEQEIGRMQKDFSGPAGDNSPPG